MKKASSKPPKRHRKAERLRPYSLRRRILILPALIVGVGFGMLTLKLYNLQIVQGEELKTSANAQRVRDTVLEPMRGSILDASGNVLAKSSTLWQVCAGPDILKNRDDNPEEKQLARDLARELAPLLKVSEEELFEKLGDYESKYKVLAKSVDHTTQVKIEEICEKYGAGNGVYCESYSVREYPYGDFAASVLGFVNSEGHGTITGLEVSYDEYLAGREGRQISARTPGNTTLATDSVMLYPAEDGGNVITTLDASIQEVVERNLEAAVREHNPKDRATAIVMDVKTGAVLAMATKPDFDPNQPAAILDTEQYNEIMAIEDEEQRTKALGDARSILWRNKAISELYDPGSVFKTVTVSSALDSGAITSASTFVCNGGHNVLGQHYDCFQFAAHGTETASDILKNSCNVGTIQIAQQMGIHNFFQYFNGFALTGRTGIDLPGEMQSIFHAEEDMTLVDLASESFGQAAGVTPIQMITAVSAVVNGGDLVTPHIVDRVEDQSGNIIWENDASSRRQVISEEVSAQMRDYIERVVAGDAADNYYSSARYANVYGYRIGGKPGTSDNLDGSEGFVSSFIGVAPIDDPQIAVLVVIDDPQSWTDLTTYISIPVAGNILYEIMPMLGIQPEYTEEEQNAQVTVPYLPASPSYQHLSVARAELARIGLDYQVIGSGDMVLNQYPSGGKVTVGSCVYLYTDTSELQTTTVPDVSGMGREQAKQVLQSAGLNAAFEGEGSSCTAQSHANGQEVPKGTVVTITLG